VGRNQGVDESMIDVIEDAKEYFGDLGYTEITNAEDLINVNEGYFFMSPDEEYFNLFMIGDLYFADIKQDAKNFLGRYFKIFEENSCFVDSSGNLISKANEDSRSISLFSEHNFQKLVKKSITDVK
jgi:hypothetical protein